MTRRPSSPAGAPAPVHSWEIAAVDGAGTAVIEHDAATPELVTVSYAGLTQPLFLPSGADAVAAIDWHTGLVASSVDDGGLELRYASTLWREKRYRLEIRADHAVFRHHADGRVAVDTCRYFEACIGDGRSEDHYQLKHFNDYGSTSSRRYSTRSPVGFAQVLVPEPTAHARQWFEPHESAFAGVAADLSYCGGNFVANPGLLCFVLGDPTRQAWLGMGPAPEPGAYRFSDFAYEGGSSFGLSVRYWGVDREEDGFDAPDLLLIPGRDPFAVLRRYVELLHERAAVPSPRSGPRPRWWTAPIVSGGGHQYYAGDVFRVRSPTDRPRDQVPHYMSTQYLYDYILRRLDELDLPWGTLIVELRWAIAMGTNVVDVGRWPDIGGFTDAVHARGKRVLAWIGPWETDGVPASRCITYRVDPFTARNPEGRFLKHGLPVDGQKMAPDVTLPEVEEDLRRQVRRILGPPPDGYGFDGLKIDHTAATPSCYGLTFPVGSERVIGIELLRRWMDIVYDEAKRTRPDALVLGQSPNPYFSACQDMLRLGDMYSVQRDSVADEMRFRARMARLAGFDLIDTDGWPMPSIEAMREYSVEVQPELGVPSLYYVTHLDTTGEAIPDDVFAAIRQAWLAYRRTLDAGMAPVRLTADERDLGPTPAVRRGA